MNKRSSKLRMKICSLFVAICMVLAMTACGNVNPEKEAASSAPENTTGAVETTILEPESDPEPDLSTLVDPAEMEWGYETDSNDYQHWYPDGDKGSDYYLIFEDDYVTVDDGGNRTTFSTTIADGHIVNWSEDDPAMDFVFLDNLTCYDIIGEQWYMSAVYDEAMDSLTAATFYCEAGDQWSFTFYDDGTYSLDFDGEITEGQWWFNNACTICFMDDYGEAWIEVYYDDSSWEITGLEYVSEMYYPGA